MYRIEDWRFSEKLLQSRSGLKIEDSQKNFFNPILDWRLKIPSKTSSIQSWMCEDVWGCVRMCEDVWGCVRMCEDVWGCVRMCDVRVRNVEVYKAQRQLRPIQLKISLVAIQDFTQVKNIRNFTQFWVVVIQLKNQLVIFDILSCMMCFDILSCMMCEAMCEDVCEDVCEVCEAKNCQ